MVYRQDGFDIPAWVARHLPDCERGFRDCSAIGVAHRGRLIAGVVFHDWCPARGLIELSCAAVDKRWMTREVMRTVWDYAFKIARMAVAKTSARNDPVRRIWRACGATEYVIADLWGEGEDGVVLTLSRDRWEASKFMEGCHGQGRHSAAA